MFVCNLEKQSLVHRTTLFMLTITGNRLLCWKAGTWCNTSQGGKMNLTCLICGKTVEGPRKRLLEYIRKGRAFCSPVCSREYCRQKSSEVMSRTNRKYASLRMKANNPMAIPLIVEKMKTTKRANGTLNVMACERGGNGRVSATQQLLALALGWQMEYAVSLGGRFAGYPTCYKVNIANPVLKIAIEVDGASHHGSKAKERDAKKNCKLNQLGWTVLRFTNRQVNEDLLNCVEKVLYTTSKLKAITTISPTVC